MPSNVGIMMASICALALAAGRLVAGLIAKYVSWLYVLLVCIVCTVLMVVFTLLQTLNIAVVAIKSFVDVPLIAYTFPLTGLFLAPIYPLINSVVLSALPKKAHSPMTGLIVVFSALGGTTGAIIVGWLFEHEGSEKAFYDTLIPMTLLLVVLFLLFKITSKNEN